MIDFDQLATSCVNPYDMKKYLNIFLRVLFYFSVRKPAVSIPANSPVLGVSLTPAGWKLRSHAGSHLHANFSRLIEKCELLPSYLTQFPKIC